jgi:hypothetical protein
VFRHHHPKANVLLKLSTVGFNQSRDQALVYVQATYLASAQNNCLSSVGFAVLFKREQGQWVFVKEADLWVS